ncbi:hypothetical protein OSB04_028136 [Centaurea solstitialis]|uniref:Gag-pol polyprotein n=1 Tax=Centaurea solstitialis TaxID=347529 RepID=A0AA38SSL6_9ASTR|nr:hypothetical protein OSB04_028136 [Centaurea solstitialis]
MKTLMAHPLSLDKDSNGKYVDLTLYRGMIGSLLYLTTSRPDIMYATCLCARYQAGPKESHLTVSTTGGCQLLGGKLVSWTSKKQNSVSISTVEAEYVAAGSCCAQVLWMRNQLQDYDIKLSKIPIYYDNTSTIAIANNRVLHSKQSILKRLFPKQYLLISTLLSRDFLTHERANVSPEKVVFGKGQLFGHDLTRNGTFPVPYYVCQGRESA